MQGDRSYHHDATGSNIMQGSGATGDPASTPGGGLAAVPTCPTCCCRAVHTADRCSRTRFSSLIAARRSASPTIAVTRRHSRRPARDSRSHLDHQAALPLVTQSLGRLSSHAVRPWHASLATQPLGAARLPRTNRRDLDLTPCSRARCWQLRFPSRSLNCRSPPPWRLQGC